MKYQKNRGVTLIELLGATAILAVLFAMLLPAVSKMRSRAQGTTCVSNLRQIGVAISSYGADHNGELPVNDSPNISSDDGVRWYLMLNPYLGKSAGSGNGGWARPSIFICPANDPKLSMGQWAIYTDFGYWANAFFMPKWNKAGNVWSNGKGPQRLMNAPKERILVADKPKDATDYFIHFRNEAEANTKKPYPPADGDDKNAKAYIHGKGINALFADTSVRFLDAADVNRPGNEISTGAYFGGPK